MMENIKAYFKQWETVFTQKNWVGLAMLLLPIVLTVVVVVVFKIKLWTPAKRQTKYIRRRVRTYRARRRARRANR